MATRRFIKDPEYEYKTVRASPNRYPATESMNVDHRFNYVKRRRMQYSTKYTGFLPFCKCGFNGKWHASKDSAIIEHLVHVKQYCAMNNMLEGLVY